MRERADGWPACFANDNPLIGISHLYCVVTVDEPGDRLINRLAVPVRIYVHQQQIDFGSQFWTVNGVISNFGRGDRDARRSAFYLPDVVDQFILSQITPQSHFVAYDEAVQVLRLVISQADQRFNLFTVFVSYRFAIFIFLTAQPGASANRDAVLVAILGSGR